MKRSNLLLALHLIIPLTILACCLGCNGQTSTPLPTHPPPTPVNEEPVSCSPDDVIKIGYSTDSPSFADAGPQGFDIDLMNHVASSAGFEKTYVERPWATIINDLERGRIAVAIGAIPIIPAYVQQVDFSEPYFERGLVIVVQEGSSIQGADNLGARTVGVQQGSDGQGWCQNDTQAVCIAYAKIDEAFKALDRGDIEAVVCEKLSAVRLIQDNAKLALQLRDGIVTDKEEYGYKQYGIAVRQGCPELLEAINDGLARARSAQSGVYSQICRVRFGMVEACTLAQTSPPALASATTPTPTLEPGPSPIPTSSPMPTPRCDAPTSAAGEAGQDYIVEPGDWLSSIANEAYGNPTDYRAIVYYNNQKCQTTADFHCIDSPDRISVGWTLYLPSFQEVEAYWAGVMTLPEINWGTSGYIAVTGSSTVYLLSRRMGHCFEQGGFSGHVTVESVGTGGGFKAFCEAGEGDIVDASRPINETELAQCRNIGREPIAFQVGTDAIAIVVSKQNSFVEDVTLEELKQILSTAKSWSDVRDNWPDAAIERHYPTDESGTFDVMAARLFDDNPGALLAASNIKMMSEDDDVLAQGIQESPYAVGFFGYAYYRANSATLRTLPVDGVEPRPETVDLGAYPLVRPLFIYTAGETLNMKPQTAAFLNFYLRQVKHYIVDVGYFMPDEEAYQEAIRCFNQAIQ